MKQDLFRYLPSEIFTDILLRLPLQTTATCKCVCKPWLDLIESDAFLESHFSKSAPVLAVSMPATDSNRFHIFKMEEDKHDLITKFDFPQASTIRGSANGLLLLKNPFIDHLYVCNPITREFVVLRGRLTCPRGDCYGFGVSRISGQHKVVYLNPEYGCHVYTLEKGALWRRVETPIPSFARCYGSTAAFVNGNLHWLVSDDCDYTAGSYICCFDVETESFSTIPLPFIKWGKLYALGDCLCFILDCYIRGGSFDPYVIWLFEGYKCWRNVHINMHVISLKVWAQHAADYLRPIKVYENGDMFMVWKEKRFIYYTNKSKTFRKVDLFSELQNDRYYINSILFTPSLLSLKRNLGMENVMSF
ncbi:putative F-box protein At3g16210 [Salvia hispanica]|uniref:putative F-box protein At3g16210 n=1 Tax=Salvia hispanica TaxID=49212 RepID=UPI002009A68C|nr:putative F-box protein At3g16210 [Salvia hispanica]